MRSSNLVWVHARHREKDPRRQQHEAHKQENDLDRGRGFVRLPAESRNVQNCTTVEFDISVIRKAFFFPLLPV